MEKMEKISDETLFHRLDEIEGRFTDMHISAYEVDSLMKEKKTIKEELTLRGHKLSYYYN